MYKLIPFLYVRIPLIYSFVRYVTFKFNDLNRGSVSGLFGSVIIMMIIGKKCVKRLRVMSTGIINEIDTLRENSES
jgi:hypothetical protein